MQRAKDAKKVHTPKYWRWDLRQAKTLYTWEKPLKAGQRAYLWLDACVPFGLLYKILLAVVKENPYAYQRILPITSIDLMFRYVIHFTRASCVVSQI